MDVQQNEQKELASNRCFAENGATGFITLNRWQREVHYVASLFFNQHTEGLIMRGQSEKFASLETLQAGCRVGGML